MPLKKSRDGEYKIPSGSTIRVCMTSDFFLTEADEWRKEVKTYNIPKAYQRVMALKSELQNPLIYKGTDIKIQLRCKTCKRRNSCNGCKWCGRCNSK